MPVYWGEKEPIHSIGKKTNRNDSGHSAQEIAVRYFAYQTDQIYHFRTETGFYKQRTTKQAERKEKREETPKCFLSKLR